MPGEELGRRMVLTAIGKRYESIYANHVLDFDYDGPSFPMMRSPAQKPARSLPYLVRMP